ncbi:hypothetical protein AMATHDRAFT_7657 [Amanita thiersii Skay4041]|uniref:WW domain-containing protein n=1 Tax=Amanita thiersii Skay4041 TaxID=703135 RepID=A0A2A9NE77_9AGAR|nr:hypothetical protein AMATHDRAFT_7657 [Amanita thiersii Skay4041]
MSQEQTKEGGSKRASLGPFEDSQSILDFIQTTRYQKPFEGVAYVTADGKSYIVAPPSWSVHRHPNGDIYFYNPERNLITPDDITEPEKLELVIESWDDHMHNIEHDPLAKQLGDNWELILSDVTDTSMIIEMISRSNKAAYNWTENRGLERWEGQEHFWSLLAEYPSHHQELPHGVEDEFVRSIYEAKEAIQTSSAVFPLTGEQIDHVITRYHQLKDLQAEGMEAIPTLTWLMGAVMPLNSIPVRSTAAVEQGVQA